MRRLTILLLLLTGMSMLGLALMKGFAGRQAPPPQTTWDTDQNEVFPAPGLEMAGVDDRDRAVEENLTTEVDPDSTRRELGPTSRPTTDGEGPVLLVIDKATDLPIAGARVAFVDQKEARTRHREEEGPVFAHQGELAERYGAILMTGPEGKVQLPRIPNWLVVAATHEDKFGAINVRPDPGIEARLALERDETLVLQVIDSTGAGREGVPLGVYQGHGWSEARRLWRGESSTGGFVSLNHFQLLRRGADEGSRFVTALRIPLGQPAATEFSGSPLPDEPVTVQLPLTGSVELRLVDAEGGDVVVGGRIKLQAMRSEKRSPDLPLPEKFDLLSTNKVSGEGSFSFSHVGLNLELLPSCILSGDRRYWSAESFRGPTVPDELLQARVFIPGEITLLSGVVVDGEGNPRSDERVDFQIDGTDGRIARSRVTLGSDGRFELAARFKDKTPPFALQIQTRRGEDEPIIGLRMGLPNLAMGRQNDLGDLTLEDLHVVAHGSVVDELGKPVPNASVFLQCFEAAQTRSPDGAAATGAARWVTQPMTRTKTDEQGRFELVGRIPRGQLRLLARCRDHLNTSSPEIAPGAEVDLQLTRAGSLRGGVTVPSWVPKSALIVRLDSQDASNPTRMTRVRASSGRGSFRLTKLPAGVYDLTFELTGFNKPLLQVHGLPIVAGENGQNPQLQGLDLTPFLHRFLLRIFGPDGSQPADGTIVVRYQVPTGEMTRIGFDLRDGQSEFVAPDSTLDVTVRARGYRSQQLNVFEGSQDLYLEKSPSVSLHIPGLRELVSPDRDVLVILERSEPASSEPLRVIDQRAGRSDRAGNAQIDVGTALLGPDSTVSIPLDSEGAYKVSMHVVEKEATVVVLGLVQVDLSGTSSAPIEVPWDRDKVAEAIGQSGQDGR